MREIWNESYYGLQIPMQKVFVKQSILNRTNKLYNHVDGNTSQDQRGLSKLCLLYDTSKTASLRHGINLQTHLIGRCTEVGISLYSQVKM